MRGKSVALLALALGCGLVASIGITQVVAKRGDSSLPAGEGQPIFVAMKDIGLGEPLSTQVVKLEQWPKDKVPAGALARLEDVDGRCTRQRLFAGEPILENKLFAKGVNSAGAGHLIPKGMRLVSVRVDQVSGGGNLVLPGNRVDLLVFLSRGSQREIGETSARTILEDVKVFAVNEIYNLDGKDGDEKSMKAQTISLLVTPEQAEVITLASEMGKLRLVLRSVEDDKLTKPKGTTAEKMFGGPEGADRTKESLVEPTGEQKAETGGFIDFIKQMQNKTQPAAQPAPAADQPLPPPPTVTWTMRLLQAGEMNDVTMEADARASAAGDAPLGTWKVNGLPASTRPAKDPPQPKPVDEPKPAKPEPKKPGKK